MADISAIFFLVAVLHGNPDSFSFSSIASFPNQGLCEEVAKMLTTAIDDGGKQLAEIGCLSGAQIEAMKQR